MNLVSSPKDADRVVAVDVSNLAHRSYQQSQRMCTSTYALKGHVANVLGNLREILNAVAGEDEACCLAFCYDGVGHTEARRRVLPGYKGDRPPDAFKPTPDVARALRCVRGVHLEQAEREGDDAMAAVVAWARSRRVFPTRVTLCTEDTDSWALIWDSGYGPSAPVRVYRPQQRKFVGPDDLAKKFHGLIIPRGVVYHKVFCGDSGDYIPAAARLLNKKLAAQYADEACRGLFAQDQVWRVGDFTSAARKVVEMVGSSAAQRTFAEKVSTPEAFAAAERNLLVVAPRTDGFKPVRQEGDREGLRAVLAEFEVVPAAGELDLFGGGSP